MYLTQQYADSFAPNAQNTQDLMAQHNMIYVVSGDLSVNGTKVAPDSAVYVEDYADICAGEQGAKIWRWTITREAERPLTLLRGNGVTSCLRLSRQVKMFELVPTSKWLFRLDRIVEFEGSTGLHSHPGSGIRCLLSGHLRTESDKGENTNNAAHGDVWYEEGSYPLISTVNSGEKATFLRGMILPPEYLIYGETATWIEGCKATYKEWKAHEQKLVVLR
ncbi:hypothetical protein OIDMADRAFT_61019 [Oidiodendron maius Zn]|uniref:Cupin 2 conserved barrel domain-containing protein n=1 Tax=Oidiodendron maius (strain Zn) TaxID=913774 RepID=A0A0C3C5N7_OIDMZ|nr:hypothetical protein OIDMADRAFT_61019 [Oidiodendron maius Zn]